MFIFKIFWAILVNCPPERLLICIHTSSAWEHEHTPQWLLGWNRRLIGLEKSGKLLRCRDVREAERELWGRQAGGWVRESSGLLRHRNRVMSPASLSDSHVKTWSTVRRHYQSKRPLQAAGRLRIVEEFCWHRLLELSCLDNQGLKPFQLVPACSSRSLPDGEIKLWFCPWSQISFAFLPLLLFEFLIKRMW